MSTSTKTNYSLHIRIPSRQFRSDCQIATTTVLSGAVNAASRWQTLQSEHAALTYLTPHTNGIGQSLVESSLNGCRLCAQIVNQLQSLDEFCLDSDYHVFFWGLKPNACELSVALGDVGRFVKHVSHWTQPRSLVFFSRTESDIAVEAHDEPLNVYARRGTPLYKLPARYPDSDLAFGTARKWLGDCVSYHDECLRPPSRLPKRVLDLGESRNDSNVSLYITKGEIARYATLSYTWGEAKRILTKRDNIEQRCKGINLEEVPKTLRHGIRVAKALNFRYLWIDSLCIIQKDKLDWVEQGAAMTEIYGLSTLNISASSTTNSDEGILMKTLDHGSRVGTLSESPNVQDAVVSVGPPVGILDLEEKYISSRGWVFQERLVSPATLHYTDEGMIWECAQGIQLGHSQNVFSTKWKAHWKSTMDQGFSERRGDVQNTGVDCFERWHDWVCAYSERKLFDWRDKFPAIAGVAKSFAKAFNVTYAAGMWKENMIAELLSRRHNRKPTLTRFEEYVAPTWSWASVHGRLEYRNSEVIDSWAGPKLSILNIIVDEEKAESYGRIRDGRIVAEGQLQKVVLDRNFHPGVRQKSFQECGISQGFKNTINVLCMLDEFDTSGERYYSCWCLRVGSFDSWGRRGDYFLLLQQTLPSTNPISFRRVGFAETDPWQNVLSTTADSGVFVSGNVHEIVLT